MKKNSVVAILKGEEKFLDEWLVYHRMIGIDHFYLYDDDPLFPLEKFLYPHRKYVTVINWYGMDVEMPGNMNQTKAYMHAVTHHVHPYEWVVFIDADEFIVLRKHKSVHKFLSGFDEHCSAVSLFWHIFGHNGFYEDPPGLVTTSLTRRMLKPGSQMKTFNRPGAIAGISTPHYCHLKSGLWLDANHRPFNYYPYPGLTDTAHINHYQCRSFVNWINRAKRGDVNFKNEQAPQEHHWRLTEESCLRHFVATVAKDRNEFVDEYMLRYKKEIESGIKKIRKNI